MDENMAFKKPIKREKISYSKMSLQEQMEINLRKTKGLLKREEYSTAVIRAVTTIDLYITGLIKKRLQEKLSEKMTKDILNNKPLHTKLNLFLKECYGFSASEEFPNQYNQLCKDIEIRNKIIHEGRFPNKPVADKAVQNVEELILNLKNKITEGEFEA